VRGKKARGEVEITQLVEHFKCDEDKVLNSAGQPRVKFARGQNVGKRCATCHGVFTSKSFYPIHKDNPTGPTNASCKQCNYFAVVANRRGVAQKIRKEAKNIKEETVEAIKRDIFKLDKRITRKAWPSDPDKRRKALDKVIPQAIDDYRGEFSAMSAGINLPITEIQQYIEADPDLQQRLENAQIKAISEVEAHLLELCLTSTSPTAAMFWLKNKAPEKWSDKSQVEVKNTGLSLPPVDADAQASVLQLFRKEGNDDG